MRRTGLALIALAGLFLIFPALATGADGDGMEIDESQIYLGNSQSFSKPAQVDVDAVYKQIPEYQEILRKGMEPDNPRYMFLMRAASERFRAALEAVAEKEGYDLIGGLGAIVIEGQQIPTITKKVIAALPD